MKIAVNSRLLVPNKMDGIARFTLESFEVLCKKHPEAEFTFIFDRQPPPIDFGKHTKNVSLGPPARHPILWYIWFEHRLKNYLNRNQFDLFISPEGWVPPKLKAKSLSVIHDLNFFHQAESLAYSHRLFLTHYFPKYAKRANRIATVSEFSKKDIAHTLSIKNTAIDVVYNGVNGNFKSTSEAVIKAKEKYTQGTDFFIFVGTIHPRKNLENTLLAFDHFKKHSNTEEKLVVVGNRKWWTNKLEAIYSSMNFKDDVIFTSRVDDKELAALLSASIALLYVPLFEGFGIPILEAFQCGTAVITAKHTSLPEVAADAALYAKADDFKSIAAQMESVTNDPKLRDTLIGKGKKRLDHFSWEKTADLLWESAMKCLRDES